MAYLPLDTRNRWFNILWNENLQKVHIKAGDIHVFINLKTGVITIQWGGGGGREARGKTQAGGRTCNGKWVTWTLCSSLPTPTGYGAHIN